MIFAIRPEPGLQSTLRSARELGLAIIGRPLFEVVPIRWKVPDAAGFDGLLIGSANAIRHGGDALEALHDLPIHAVGEATAEEARERGFAIATIGDGGLQQVVESLDGEHRLLRLAGTEHVPLALSETITVDTRVVYDVRALPLTGSDEISLRAAEPLVLLHSAAAARHFAAECGRRGLDKTRIGLACIGPRVAEAAGKGWRVKESAPHPDDAALLALAQKMWQ
ncbi:MAG: uroporphyrinogen-III synthase [Alteraurantiacibacter sp.]